MSENEKDYEFNIPPEVEFTSSGAVTQESMTFCPKCGNAHHCVPEPDGIEKVYLPTVV